LRECPSGQRIGMRRLQGEHAIVRSGGAIRVARVVG
jgi:hypothetical protein